MNTKELIDLMKLRRSVRIFTGQKVSQDQLNQILEAAIWAPTGCNMQEMRFLILDKPKDIELIGRFKTFFQGVSHYILILCDMGLPVSVKKYVKNRHEWRLPYMDTGLAMMNMALVAKNLGLETCVFNLSEYHFSKPKPAGILTKLIRVFKTKFNLGLTTMDNNFEYVLRHELGISKRYKITGAVALGYGKFVPDPTKIYHRGEIINRRPLEYYLLKKNQK